MNKFKLIYILLVVGAVDGWSQETQQNIPWGNYLVLGGGYSKMSVDETVNTILPYTGPGMATALEVQFGAEKHYCHIRNAFTFGDLSPYQSSLQIKIPKMLMLKTLVLLIIGYFFNANPKAFIYMQVLWQMQDLGFVSKMESWGIRLWVMKQPSLPDWL